MLKMKYFRRIRFEGNWRREALSSSPPLLATPLRVLTVTNMYPTPARPVLGTFVAEQVASLRGRGITVDVLFVDGPASAWNYLRGPGDLRRALPGRATI